MGDQRRNIKPCAQDKIRSQKETLIRPFCLAQLFISIFQVSKLLTPCCACSFSLKITYIQHIAAFQDLRQSN